MAGPNSNAPPADPLSRVWITLVTRASYLPGVALLVHTLYRAHSVHPLVVQYTDTLPADCLAALRALQRPYPLLRLQRVAPIALPQGLVPVAPRFDDTLTKLRAFAPPSPAELGELGLPAAPAQACFLDADMTVRRNMDDVFDVPRPGPDWIAAHHVCVCNIDYDPWAPPEWNPENCPSSPLVQPSALDCPVPCGTDTRPTYQLLNSGVFLFTPSADLWRRIDDFRRTDERVKGFTFPDQNFLVEFFRGKWVPIGWQYNASKTNRYWHPASWRDDEVRGMHYIVDKPWDKRIGPDGVAGYLGRDGVTHSWWWRDYGEWEREMEEKGETEALEVVKKYMAPPLAEEA